MNKYYCSIFFILISTFSQLNAQQSDRALLEATNDSYEFTLSKYDAVTAKIECVGIKIGANEMLEILHSTDDKNYAVVAMFSEAKIKTNQKLEFLHSYTENGRNYYQIRKNDAQGNLLKESKSQVLELEIAPVLLNLTHNQQEKEIGLVFNLLKSQAAKISIRDRSGTTHKDYFITGLKGQNQLFISSKFLKEGNYILSFETANGTIYKKLTIPSTLQTKAKA